MFSYIQRIFRIQKISRLINIQNTFKRKVFHKFVQIFNIKRFVLQLKRICKINLVLKKFKREKQKCNS